MLKNGGDGFVMFKGDKLIKDSVMLDNQVLINYIVEKLGGVVGSDYANPRGQGRISIVDTVTPDVPSGGGGGYSDTASVSPWASDAVSMALRSGLLTGKPGGLIDPQGQASRAEIAVMLQRFVESVLK